MLRAPATASALGGRGGGELEAFADHSHGGLGQQDGGGRSLGEPDLDVAHVRVRLGAVGLDREGRGFHLISEGLCCPTIRWVVLTSILYTT